MRIPTINVLDLQSLCTPDQDNFVTLEVENSAANLGYNFDLKTVEVVDGKLSLDGFSKSIQFVKGTAENTGYKQSGITAITLIECVIQHLSHVNKDPLSTSDTTAAIEYLKVAQSRLISRAMDRERRGVLNTLKPWYGKDFCK